MALWYGVALYAPDLQDKSVLNTVPPIVLAPVLTAYLYLTAGTPLRLDLALMAEWGTEWVNLACSVCLACGYHYPRPRRSCSICGGVIGSPADWERRRVRTTVN